MTDPAPVTANRYTAPSGAIATVLVALAASLLLLLAWQQREVWPAGLRFVWIALAVMPPLLLAGLLRELRDPRAWVAAAAMGLLFGLLAAWRAGQLLGPDDAISTSLTQHLVVVGSAGFLLIPFLQCWRDGGVCCYPRLVQYAWDNALVLLVAAFFTLAGWLLLYLWAALFELIGIDVIHHLLRRAPFAYPISGLLVGIGLALARSQLDLLQNLRRVLLRIGELLLALLALITLMFVLALPFAGLDGLWQTRSATGLLLTLIFALVALQSSVHQDGRQPPPYGRVLRVLLRLALLCLPVLALIAAYALALRVGQYGWTVDRLWAALLVGIALLYAIAHAVAALWRGPWLAPLAAANPLIAVLVAATLLLTQSPLLDLSRISVSSQLARAEAGGEQGFAALDLIYLRGQGRAGREALQQLHEAGRGDLAEIERLLAARRPWQPEPEAVQVAETYAVPFHQVPVIPSGTEVPPALLDALGRPEVDQPQLEPCSVNSCRLLGIDLDGDAQLEWVLLRRQGAWTSLLVFALHDDRWRRVGHLQGEGRERIDLIAALEAGDYATRVPRWHALRIGPRMHWLRSHSEDE